MRFWKRRKRGAKDVDAKMRRLRAEMRQNAEMGNQLKHLLDEFMTSMIRREDLNEQEERP